MIVSIAVEEPGWRQIPALDELTQDAVNATLANARAAHENFETAFLFTNDDAVAGLNSKWRGKPSPTNVLSFPAKNAPVAQGESRPLGDVVLAWGVVSREAASQGKTLPHHAAHLIVHGLLHLLGHDHETDEEAAVMQQLETQIMKDLGFPDPYERQ